MAGKLTNDFLNLHLYARNEKNFEKLLSGYLVSALKLQPVTLQVLSIIGKHYGVMFGTVPNTTKFNKFLNENLSDLKYEEFISYHKEYFCISNYLKSLARTN